MIIVWKASSRNVLFGVEHVGIAIVFEIGFGFDTDTDFDGLQAAAPRAVMTEMPKRH